MVIMRWVIRAVGWVSLGLASTSFCLGIVMMLHIDADVFGRQILSSPVPGTYQCVSHWYMVGFIFLPVAFVQYKRKHLKVTAFTLKLPDIGKGILDIIGLGFMAAIFGVFCWYSWPMAIHHMEVGSYFHEVWDVTVWPVYFYVPIGTGAVALQALAHIVEDSYSLIRKGRIEAAVAAAGTEE